ncbi:hypothetical protein B0A50_05464 [Salinomyces thailandicus]|uniref:Rieske domain-containing protein n=1 Tax=Salinomyces thailandicus TaxID=706561 RepID=A0A4U0TTJ7_9PEZI|nr:hypothetical protein B0A50_05464 [Salinomyces thailandica]
MEQWHYAGLASTLPNIEPTPTDPKAGRTRISKPPPDPWDEVDPNEPPPPCRILPALSHTQSNGDEPHELSLQEAQDTVMLGAQILLFRYRGKVHAIDHSCPHASYPLSRGSLYDIEDFGIVLSAGVVCPKHGWSFDLHTGSSDRGKYQLGVYEVETREGSKGEEVWVRRKEKGKAG